MPIILQAWIINGSLIAVAVVIHYEILRVLSTLIPRWPIQHRMKVVMGVLAALTANVIEIWVFGTSGHEPGFR